MHVGRLSSFILLAKFRIRFYSAGLSGSGELARNQGKLSELARHQGK